MSALKSDKRNQRGTLFQDRLNQLLERAQSAADWLRESQAGTHPEQLGAELQDAINSVRR